MNDRQTKSNNDLVALWVLRDLPLECFLFVVELLNASQASIQFGLEGLSLLEVLANLVKVAKILVLSQLCTERVQLLDEFDTTLAQGVLGLLSRCADDLAMLLKDGANVVQPRQRFSIDSEISPEKE